MVTESTKRALIISSASSKLKKQREEIINLKNSGVVPINDVLILNNILEIYDEIIITIDSNILVKKANEIPLDFDVGYIAFLINNTPINRVKEEISTSNYKDILYSVLENISKIQSYLISYFSNKNIFEEAEKTAALIQDVESQVTTVTNLINQNNILSEDLRNKTIHEIYDEDSKKFKKTARLYEIAFYTLLLLLAFYLFGYHFEIKTQSITFKLAEHFDDSNKTAFYIQKISLIILSSSLAAFLLKRSFMNRRLADEAYRTAKEIDGLPRYMVGLPEEMREKIRFDLAYKYFGNGIHHESYTGGENLMHENMKANTDFIMAVKDLNKPSDDKPNSEGK